VHDDIWLVSFMDYDLGYFDLKTRVLEPLQNPFGLKVLPMFPGWTRDGMVRPGGFELPTFWFVASRGQNPNGLFGVAYEFQNAFFLTQ
jgi:hypothetical protein